MSVIFCYKQQPQPWMYYITPDKITFSGDCCPALVTDLTHLLPFQVISQGAFQKLEYRLYGETAWTELTITYSEVMIEGFYFISYNGTSVTALPCGVYEFRLTAGEVWWFEPIKIEDFTISENTLTVRDELMTPFKISEQIIDTTPLIAPCDRILPFMFRTSNVTSGTITVYMVDESGTETEITITVSTGVIDGMTYYWHSEEYLYPFLTCGRYYLKIVDGANTYYSVPFVPECGISDIPDGYKVLRDFNGCVIRNNEGVIEYEEASDIPDPEPPVEEISYGLLYNWYAATDARNIAAAGWHVPSQTEWETMTAYIGATIIPYEFGGNRIQAPNTLGIKLKETGTNYWNTPNTGATNEVGFNVKGAGQRGLTGFSSIKTYTTFWSSNDNYALPMRIYGITLSNASQQLSQWTPGGRDVRKQGMSLRLLKDSTTLTHGQTGTYVGNDGKVYRTICIGTQEWLADNLAETKYRNGDDILEVTDNAAWVALTSGALCAYDNDWNNV